jgi:GNAT superfamily N-acetyltransferase
MHAKMIEIKLLNKEVSLAELTSLVHRSYRQLASLGFKYWATHQSVEDTKKRIEKGECYVGFADKKMVATVTLNDPNKIGGHPWYDKTNVTSFSQFAVDPEYQRKGIGSKLMDFLEQRAIEIGVEEIACDTAEGATHLIDMYIVRGYRVVGKANWDITNYTSVILSKKLT